MNLFDFDLLPVCVVRIPAPLLSLSTPELRARLENIACRRFEDSGGFETHGLVDIRLAEGEGTVELAGRPAKSPQVLRRDMEFVRRDLLLLLNQPSELPLDPFVRCGVRAVGLGPAQAFRLRELVRLEITRTVAQEVGILVQVQVDGSPQHVDIGFCRLDALHGHRVHGLRRHIAEIVDDIQDAYEAILNPLPDNPRALIQPHELAAEILTILDSEALYLEEATRVLNAIPRRVGHVGFPRRYDAARE